MSKKQVTESEPGGLIPPGGKVAIVIICDAKYVARGFGEFALGTFVRLSVWVPRVVLLGQVSETVLGSSFRGIKS